LTVVPRMEAQSDSQHAFNGRSVDAMSATGPEQSLLYQVIDEHYPDFWHNSRSTGARCRNSCSGNLLST